MTSADFTYRKGTLDDKEQLKHIGIVSFAQYSPILDPEHNGNMMDSLNDDEKLVRLINMSEIFVCVDKDKIIGTAYFIPNGNPWDIFKTEWSYIRMVSVEPAYQGKGIAKTLTAQCIAHAKKTNEKTIALHTSEMMDAARHIYESLGFKMLHEIESRLGKKYWLYTLEI